jgi:hypothetical protein
MDSGLALRAPRNDEDGRELAKMRADVDGRGLMGERGMDRKVGGQS